MSKKEVVINTSGVNSYGSRVITSGIDIGQYVKNPVLLWMHRRFGDTMPIGRMENLRLDGDRLIGTPVFDENDEFAKKIADKWDHGFLNMCSAGIEILETSVDPADLLAGQTRATVTHSKLVEVSIVDIGANDEALKLYNGGKMLTLAAGEKSPLLPMLELEKKTSNAETSAKSNKNKQTSSMNKETMLMLGLSETATDEQIQTAVQALKTKADRVEQLQLASITAAVDAAITDKRITADKRDHFISLGKAAGLQSLNETLALMKPAQKPTEVIDTSKDNAHKDAPKTFAKLSDVPEAELLQLRKEKPQEYARLYKAEYGIECPKLVD